MYLPLDFMLWTRSRTAAERALETCTHVLRNHQKIFWACINSGHRALSPTHTINKNWETSLCLSTFLAFYTDCSMLASQKDFLQLDNIASVAVCISLHDATKHMLIQLLDLGIATSHGCQIRASYLQLPCVIVLLLPLICRQVCQDLFSSGGGVGSSQI